MMPTSGPIDDAPQHNITLAMGSAACRCGWMSSDAEEIAAHLRLVLLP
jgi:hypothetical protein